MEAYTRGAGSAEPVEAARVLPARAQKLVITFGHDAVVETVEYLAAQVIGSKRKSVDNPAGLIVYSLENALPVPAGFMSSRRVKALEQARHLRRVKQQKQLEDETAYAEWLDAQQERAVHEHYSDKDLEVKVDQLARELARRDERVQRMPENARKDVALRMLRKELAAEIQLPSFEEWRVVTEQTRLF